MPWFSIVTPAYNRAGTLRRAIDSCLAQDFEDFELLVIDDGSHDDTAPVAKSYRDARVRVLQHAGNRGPCPARNTGIDAASGEWCVMLDSDFALMPGALSRLRARTAAATRDVGNVASACNWDSGAITPTPMPQEGRIDYRGYLRFVETLRVSEYFNCVRRSVFDHVRYPDNRAWELEFHINLAFHYSLDFSPVPAVMIYTDANNRLTDDRSAAGERRLRDDALDKLESLDRVLAAHGTALRRFAPTVYRRTVASTAHQAFLAGHRSVGLRRLGHALALRPIAKELWGLLAVGMLGPRMTARATVRKRAASVV